MTNFEDFPILLAQEGPLKGERWPLEDALVLGRDATCNLTIPDRKVSRYHARLTPTSDGVLLEDMGSKNGTFCNGEVLKDSLILEDGDLIQIAVTQSFMFLISDATMPLTESNTSMGRLMMDLRSRRVLVDEKQVTPPLSAQQFRLLWRLFEQEGDVVSRSDLVVAVWGEDESFGVSDQALDALIRRLREKLAGYDPGHQYIVTVRGHGIRLDNPLP
ncbi:MAG: FHA domain-containing protein [Anaerolineae bacterium]|jgi:pSer/pThr/pTyr-binding forkhead associated (FHA) protein|nr:FHA domain-containing protein [Anaerolineae bacterium]MBT7074408.1 FHA domain-containing protein [Anaerolineae bacterium]MBT7782766.1 FHA domain-containing protein [Anaerolineae bacterium]